MCQLIQRVWDDPPLGCRRWGEKKLFTAMEMEPAWKKIGLAVDNRDETEIRHIETVDGKRKRIQGESKRPKRPKTKKKNPTIRDQWTYVKQFAEDRENWKFSKQKQNWVLKHVRDVPEDYEDFMVRYISTIEGGVRGRLVEDYKRVLEAANTKEESDKEEDKDEEEKDKAEKDGQEAKQTKVDEDPKYVELVRRILQEMGVHV